MTIIALQSFMKKCKSSNVETTATMKMQFACKDQRKFNSIQKFKYLFKTTLRKPLLFRTYRTV